MHEIASDCLKLQKLQKLQKLRNCRKLLKIAPNCMKLPQIASNCLKLPQIASNCHKLPQIASNCLKLPQIASNCMKLKLPKIDQNCLKLPQIASNCFKLPQIATNFFVTDSKFSDEILDSNFSQQKVARNCPKLPKVAQNCLKLDEIELLQITPNCPKLPQIASNCSKIWTKFHATQLYHTLISTNSDNPSVYRTRHQAASFEIGMSSRKKTVKLLTPDSSNHCNLMARACMIPYFTANHFCYISSECKNRWISHATLSILELISEPAQHGSELRKFVSFCTEMLKMYLIRKLHMKSSLLLLPTDVASAHRPVANCSRTWK